MGEVWALPGYDVQELLGYGSTGEVWRAVELATGQAVAVKRLRPGADPQAVAALRREALAMQRLESAHVVRLRALLAEQDAPVLVCDLAEGGSLAALLARRGTLTAGEVVTVAAPLAQALAEIHEAGLVHADVTPANVVFTAAGMPLLTDLGLARFGAAAEAVRGTVDYLDPAVVRGAEPSPAADVWALGAVCHHLLAGCPPHDGGGDEEVLATARAGGRAPLGLLAPTAPRPLVEAVERALAEDPAERPSAGELAALLRRAHAAAPVRLGDRPGPAPQAEARPTQLVRAPAPLAPPARRRALSPALLVVAAALLVLGAAAGLGWWSGRAAPQEAAAALPVAPTRAPAGAAGATRAAAGPDWPAVLGRLDAARAAALAQADPALLDRVYTRDAPPRAADARSAQALRDAGRRALGVRHRLLQVRPVQVAADRARLQVVDELLAYRVVGPDGREVERVDGRAAASYLIDLVREAAGWRIRALATG